MLIQLPAISAMLTQLPAISAILVQLCAISSMLIQHCANTALWSHSAKLYANGGSEVHLAAMAPCRGWVDLSIARPVERRGQTQWGVTDPI